MAPRTARQWENLSSAQRARYLSAGRSGALTGRQGMTPAQVRRYYLGGGLMAGGRGHKAKTAPSPTAKSRPAPKATRARQGAPRARQGAPRARIWENLGEAQRRRYVSSGRSQLGLTEAQVRSYYEGGGDLRALRGHKAPRPRYAPPAQVAERLARGDLLTDADTRALREWRESSAYPSWLPKDRAVMGDDTAALLATAGQGPKAWSGVTFTFRENNGPVTMTVTPKNGYPFAITFPDGDSAREVTAWIKSLNYPGLTVNVEGYASMGPKNAIAA